VADGDDWSPERLAAMFDRFRRAMPQLSQLVADLPAGEQRDRLARALAEIADRLSQGGRT